MIIQQRKSKGHLIKLDKITKDRQKKSFTYAAVKKVISLYGHKLEPENITEDETVFADILIYDTYIYTKEMLIPIVYDSNYIEKDTMHRFLKESLVKFQIDDALITEDVLIPYEHYFRNINHLSHLTPLFQKNLNEINTFVKREHRSTYRRWVDILLNSPLKEKLNLVYIEDVAVNLTLLNLSGSFQQNVSVKHILFSLDGNQAYQKYLSTLAKEMTTNISNISFVPNYYISNELIKEKNVDLLVYNYNLDISGISCASYQLPRIPTSEDWAIINKMILNMSVSDN